MTFLNTWMERFNKHIKILLDFQTVDLKTPQVLTQSYLPSLDGLRAISIIMVVLAHIGMSYKSDFDFYPFANAGVQFFFVISGFLITTLLLKEKAKTGTISLKKFYIRRFFRIIPIAFLYLVIVLILNFVFKLNLNLFLVFVSFVFLRNIFVSSSGIDHLTTHYWSLSVEEQFYIIFPFILRRKLSFYLKLLVTIILFSLLCQPLECILTESMRNSFLWKFISSAFTQFLGIAIGSLFSILLFSGAIKIKTSFQNRSFVIGILFTLIMLFVSLYSKYPYITIFFESLLFAVILILNLTPGIDRIYTFLNNKTMKYIGVLSYSIYIWQQPFTLNITFANSINYIKNSPYKLQIDLVISIISLISLFILSYFSYNLYEKKFLKLKEKFK